jgi:hypothetical protein
MKEPGDGAFIIDQRSGKGKERNTTRGREKVLSCHDKINDRGVKIKKQENCTA